MHIFAGTMRFDLPDVWLDNTSYDYKSMDGLLSVQVKRELFDADYVLDSLAEERINVFREGMPKATSTPTMKTKLGKYEARQGDIAFPDADGKDSIMRLILAQPANSVLIALYATGPATRRGELEKIIDALVKSFTLEGDNRVRS